MNVLLVYPEFPETFWSFKHALKFLGKRAAQPPLGLMTVAALLPHAWKKRLVDTNVERLRDRNQQRIFCHLFQRHRLLLGQRMPREERSRPIRRDESPPSSGACP